MMLMNRYVLNPASYIQIPDEIKNKFFKIYTKKAMEVLGKLSIFNGEQDRLMEKRMELRAARARNKERIGFLPAGGKIPGTEILVKDARDGKFVNSAIPPKFQKQWVQLTGPTTKVGKTRKESLRLIAHAWLSNANAYMHDSEDAGPSTGMAAEETLTNLTMAIAHDPEFMEVARTVADELNAKRKEGEPLIDFEKQLEVTAKLYRPRAMHLHHKYIKMEDEKPFSAAIADTALYVTNNYENLLKEGSPIVLYLPKIQTAEEAALWNKILTALEGHLKLERNSIKTYILAEQFELTLQIMEVRAVMGERLIGFNLARWDQIHSWQDATRFDEELICPNIEEITLKYPFMQAYVDRVRSACRTPDKDGKAISLIGGMEAQVAKGEKETIDAANAKAQAGAEYELSLHCDGKWVSHPSMVKTVQKVWEKSGVDNYLDDVKTAQPLTYEQKDLDALYKLDEKTPRTIRGARNLISVALQYGNAFLQGQQALASKPADFFTDDKVQFLMEDAATVEIRAGFLWEWVRKKAKVTNDKGETVIFTPALFKQLLDEEYKKLETAPNNIVYDHSKTTTLPISKSILETYVTQENKAPWLIDLLNISLDNYDLAMANKRIDHYYKVFNESGGLKRVTENLNMNPDFVLTASNNSAFKY